MRTINIDVMNPGSVIVIGKQGEHLATEVVFDCASWLDDVAEAGGQLQLMYMRPLDDDAYPVVCETTETELKWRVTETDLAKIGIGFAEIRYTVDERILKTKTMWCDIKYGLNPSEEVPVPYQPYIDQVLAMSRPPLVIEPNVDLSQVLPGEHYPVKNSIAEMKDALDTTRPLMLHGLAMQDGELLMEAYTTSYSTSVGKNQGVLVYQVLFRSEWWNLEGYEEDISWTHYQLVFVPDTDEAYIRQVPLNQ